MQTKPLLYGLIGFFIGGLLVSVAATTFDKPAQEDTGKTTIPMSSMSAHHVGAVENGETTSSKGIGV